MFRVLRPGHSLGALSGSDGRRPLQASNCIASSRDHAQSDRRPLPVTQLANSRTNRCNTYLACSPNQSASSGSSTSSNSYNESDTPRDGAASQENCAPSCSGRDESTSSSSSPGTNTSESQPSRKMLAAMALSPIAAMSLPLLQDGAWKEGMMDYALRLQSQLRNGLESEGVQSATSQLDHALTYMEWTWQWTGIDLSYAWDAELWVRFKEAIWKDDPAIFWNKLLNRIQYRTVLPGAGLVGDMRISYSKFLQLLDGSRIKRIVVYGDMKTAVVEVPHPWYSSIVGAPGTYTFLENRYHRPLSLLQPNPFAPDDPTQWFCPEMPEWNMEKYRFYVDLPGDFWDSGVLLRHLRSKDVSVEWDEASRQYIMPYSGMSKVFEVKTELQILDPSESWGFMAWMTDSRRVDFYEKAAAVCIAVRLLTVSISFATGTPLFKMMKSKKAKKDKKESAWEKLTSSRAREFMTKDAKTGKIRDTGVRYADIAGLDHILVEMKEIQKMLLDDPAYVKVGAKCPRGIIFMGPPGTGKTYLARAIAGEAGVAFFSAVGSEFVEMYAGVAAARVNSLFELARKKTPCIIFIDEIDAIGRARSSAGGDPGSMERESALLALLVQMDGISGRTEKVLTIGATNLASELDGALLRPGRFEVTYEISAPSPIGRLEILKYHSRNKPLANQDMLLKVAEVTVGWTAASLANLMNEAAIMTVRRNTDVITLPMVLDIVEGNSFGGTAPKLPRGEAKNRMAVITAAKAVAMALTPGLEVIRKVTLWSQKRGLGPQVEFLPSHENLDNWHPEEVEIMDFRTNFKVNAAVVGSEKLGEFLHVASLLQPLYAPRAAEIAFYGEQAASLATAPPLADCFDIAYYCVRNSMMHPRFRSLPPLHTYMWLGEDSQRSNQRDPLADGLDQELGYHSLTLTLLKASWKRVQKLVAERRTAIQAVADALLEAEDETITGARLVEIIESIPMDDSSDIVIDSAFLPLLKEVLGASIPGIVLQGEASAQDLTPAQLGQPSSQQPGQQPCNGILSFRADGASCVGTASFSRTSAAPSSPPALVLDDATLAAVSRAIMGRLDIVDLVGRNTALEAAERVRDALLDPATVERLTAVRRFVEEAGAPFPPAPLASSIGGPLYGDMNVPLEWWKQRRVNSISWSAAEMLFTERQMKHFAVDMDQPRFEDTTAGKAKAARDAAEAAASSSSPSS